MFAGRGGPMRGSPGRRNAPACVVLAGSPSLDKEGVRGWFEIKFSKSLIPRMAHSSAIQFREMISRTPFCAFPKLIAKLQR